MNRRADFTTEAGYNEDRDGADGWEAVSFYMSLRFLNATLTPSPYFVKLDGP